MAVKLRSMEVESLARLMRHLPLCYEAQRMNFWQVKHQSVTMMSAPKGGVGDGGEFEVVRIESRTAKSKVMIFR